MKLASAALIVAALCAAAPAAYAQDSGIAGRRATLSVTGEGVSTAAPDMANFSSAVVTEGKTAREALDANTKAVSDMIGAIKSTGIEDRDIATSGFTIQPQYTAPKKDSNEAPRISGYEVRNMVSVRVRDLALLGGLLDQVVTSGANQIGGIVFDIADPTSLEDTARAEAVKDARRRADTMAAAAGLRIVRVRSMNQDGIVRPMSRGMAAPAMLKAEAVPVEAGEAEIRANVSIVYEVEPL